VGCEPKIFSPKDAILIDHTDFINWNWRNVIGFLTVLTSPINFDTNRTEHF
jgi:hypothetical protein